MNTNNTSDVTTTTTTNAKTYSGKQVMGIAAGGMLLGAGLSATYRWARTKFGGSAAKPVAPDAGPAATPTP